MDPSNRPATSIAVCVLHCRRVFTCIFQAEKEKKERKERRGRDGASGGGEGRKSEKEVILISGVQSGSKNTRNEMEMGYYVYTHLR